MKWPEPECGYSVPGGHCEKPAAWDAMVERIADLEGALDDARRLAADLDTARQHQLWFLLAALRALRDHGSAAVRSATFSVLGLCEIDPDALNERPPGELSTVPKGETTCPFCARRIEYDATAPIVENLARVEELEGALDDAMSQIRDLRAWRERAWQAMREAGVEAREIMRRLDLEPTSGC